MKQPNPGLLFGGVKPVAEVSLQDLARIVEAQGMQIEHLVRQVKEIKQTGTSIMEEICREKAMKKIATEGAENGLAAGAES